MTVAEERQRLWKILVASTPVMDHLWTLHPKTTRYLRGINEVVDIHLPPHSSDRTAEM